MRKKAAIEKVTSALNEQFGEGKTEFRRSEYVGPQVGEELKMQGLIAILITLGGILAYIWFRFEWQYGVAAIATLIAHDVIAVVGLFALTQLEFNLSTVAAVLLVAGYSINDTVIVFDRIREEIRRYKKLDTAALMNMAINKTLARTTMTSLTTLLALVALYAFGGPVIQDFIYALIFGIVIGTYSSIYVAAPVLMALKVKRGNEGGAQEAAA
ncbi:MAG: protein translocase subunit SecF [Alphaproteobacteria bacterium]|nr:protein translocase subunit SecF [Alphaproteobacteria bacterium]